MDARLNRRAALKAALCALCAPAVALAQESQIRPGDAVFRRGVDDAVTRAILAHSPRRPARWSHVGIAVSAGLVAHAMPGAGVHLDRLSDFCSAAAARDVEVLHIIDPHLGQRLARAAARKLGKPFDDALRMSSDDAFYCTELLVKSLAECGIALDARLVRVPFYSEAVMHPDSAYVALKASGLWS